MQYLRGVRVIIVTGLLLVNHGTAVQASEPQELVLQRIAYRITSSPAGYGSVPNAIRYPRQSIDPAGYASVQTVMTYAHEQTTENLEYLLLRKNGAWRVYDVVVEGAGMVTNYRAQFAQIIL
jgi:hypothetical protein